MTPLLRTLEALDSAVAASQVLGLDTTRAAAVRTDAAERLGLAPDVYVAALVGGTGVGKSSLLNALAGATVSRAGPRRPTTARAVAWVPAGGESTAAALQPLLDRLDADVVHGRSPAGQLRNVVILDLPDIDSLERGHRAAVEAILPKVDVVAWVTDPEKYADAVFHDTFLRDWMPRLGRQIVVVNKADRLSGDASRSVVADLGVVLRRELSGVIRSAPDILLTRAAAGPDGVTELRAWLETAADAKAVIAERIFAAATAAVADLAGTAGVGAAADADAAKSPAQAIIAPSTRDQALATATSDVLRVVDLAGVERRAIAATRAVARRRGTGPIGLVTAALYRATGRHRAVADPAGYLRAWRGRGGLTRAAEAVRSTISAAIPGMPVALRGPYASATRAGELEERIATAVDGVIVRQGAFEPPSSRAWPFIGLLQSVNTLLLVAAAAWTVIWIIAHPAVASYEVPVVGPVPAPLAWLAVALALGYVLARALSLHAGWVGRRWARRIAKAIAAAVGQSVAAEAFAPIDRLEAARTELAAASRTIAQASAQAATPG
ncbi:MAG TPA: GTPase [Candidatus Limnocylindrales bacterium]|nr:GTPase [Candidatus Limnocylindrales bacterium]